MVLILERTGKKFIQEINILSRILSVSMVLLTILCTFFPVCSYLAFRYGYDFTIRGSSASVVLLAVLFVTVSVILWNHNVALARPAAVCTAFLPMACAADGLCYMLYGGWGGCVIFVLICDACAFALLIRYAYPVEIRITFGILSALFITGSLCIALLWTLLEGFGYETAVSSAVSPRHTYTAEVIDSDQGALGGGTYVYVHNEKKVIDLFICRFSKVPLQIYAGKWGEAEEIQVSWKDEYTLVINGEEYDMQE